MSSKSNNTSSTALLAAALFAIPVVGIIGQHRHRKQQQKAYEASLRAHCDAEKALRPPFPPAVKHLLQTCRLAYLSTVDASNAATAASSSSSSSPQLSSHLSLMRFTYLPSEEVIVMSTNRHTKKYDMLLQQRGVALLVHDFGGGTTSSGGGSGEYSITLNGTCSILPNNDPRKELFRQAHLRNNPEYPQFIVGEHIAILCVDVRSARICNIADQVIHWNAANDNATDIYNDNSEKSHE